MRRVVGNDNKEEKCVQLIFGRIKTVCLHILLFVLKIEVDFYGEFVLHLAKNISAPGLLSKLWLMMG